MNQCRTISVSIKKPVPKVYAYLEDPAHFPEWSAFIVTIRRAGEDWYAITKGGEVRMTFTPRNPFGVLDHAVHPKAGPTVRVPIRVLDNLEGCEVLFSVFRHEGVSDAEFDADVALVQGDLLALKRLLESA